MQRLAILSAQTTNVPMAVLTADLSSGSDDGWYQLLPAGEFKARDGRPFDTETGSWKLDDVSGPAFVAATSKMAPKVVIDYEHAMLNADKSGEPIPAAAWLTSDADMEWRSGKGVYVRPAFTDKAQALIDAKEIGFLSAVFPYSKDGTPLYLRMAALTNDPGIVDLEPLAALSTDVSISLFGDGMSASLYGKTGDNILDELLKKMLEKLGITLNGDVTGEISTAALSAIDALKLKAEATNDAALSANAVDLSQYVPIATYNKVVGEMAVLSAKTDETSITATIEAARKDGKIVEAEVDYLTELGKQQGQVALSAMLEKRPAIAALSAQQTTTFKPEQQKKEPGELNETELAVLSATGLTKEQYLKSKESE